MSNPFLLPGAQEPADEPPVAEETRFDPLPAPVAASWRLVLPGGASIPLTGALVLGRDPAPAADDPDAALLPLDDPGRTVSKTHALLTVRDGAVLVRDLHSTNGTAVTAGSRRFPVRPDHEAPVPAGAILELGSYPIAVELGSAGG